MKATIRKRGRASLIQKGATSAAKLTKISAERQLVQRLQYVLAEIDRLPLLTGELGCQALDCFELVDKIRDKVSRKGRKLLLEQPGAIPNWHVSETPQRVLSKDTREFLPRWHRSILTPGEFIAACSICLTAFAKPSGRAQSALERRTKSSMLESRSRGLDFLRFHHPPIPRKG